MYFILYVLHDIDLLDAVLQAWEDAGVSGSTILASTGLARYRDKPALRDDLPRFPAWKIFLRIPLQPIARIHNRKIPGKWWIFIVEATEKIMSDLDAPNTGILVVLPVVQAYGLNRRLSNLIR